MPRAGLTTDRLVAAAADMADEAGLDAVTISALARRFGVKDASLYSHVANVRDLRTRMALLASRELADRLGEAVQGRAGKDALKAFADAYREFMLSHPGRYAAMQVRIAPEALAAAPGADADGPRRVIETTGALFRGYELSDPDLTDAVRLLRSTFHGYASLEAIGGFDHPRDVQASWERAVDALDFLLRNWSRAK
ncbi:TetR/AcrR family transcriptional regulator [Nocardiopsis composta]|uniref:AcrR family transcriptional regulator n=1 Tax=Nocardiopsis composta TaxID=157465 RepID=A0A7W8QGC4_9ACTN|nr:TetR-like C-terminal domain-containing protein [Nocardiopsis composta]MBB5429997.1 AcrR family transcriptional regulator [Nocardiopsis composta]